jgi:acetoacetyl-CoA synthetase
MIKSSNLQHYMAWLQTNYGLTFYHYDDLWQWSIDHTQLFWQTIWDYFQIQSHSSCQYVHSEDPMPDTKWFEGATLNYAEHIFRQKQADIPAILFQSEQQPLSAISWQTLESQVAIFAGWLKQKKVGKGDRVVAYLPNIPEATVAFLATCSVGAIWSSCSPDFGASSVVDRFQQIEPKIMIAVDGYSYNGKAYDKTTTVEQIIRELPTLAQVVWLPYLRKTAILANCTVPVITWEEIMDTQTFAPLTFEAVPFSHPIWILYSSGTTGIPKAITHSQGGVLLEHLKYLAFHNDVHAGERFFWYTTTGWMMWNFLQAALLRGATIVLYDGSPSYPNLNVLWELSEKANIQHFGTSAPFLIANMKANASPKNEYHLNALRSLSSTGSPLPPEAFDWVYAHVKSDLWLCSMSGGTDVCTAFVGGVPTEPVFTGEIQRRALGCAVFAYDEMGNTVQDEVGEMVITKPMPSMPIYFWKDEDKSKYLSSYFEMYEGIWRHGDWLKITNRNTLIILGRSDATLNRHGIRIGTAEIYQSLDKISAIKDSLIVNLEVEGGQHYMPLFVVLERGATLTEHLKKQIAQQLKNDYTPRHVPDEVIEVPEIPYTISGKKLETPVKKILMGMPIEKAANLGAMRNPNSLLFFLTLVEDKKD